METKKQGLFTNPIFVTLGAILCCALWGSATPFIKLGYRVMFENASPDIPSTILFAGIRFFFAGVLTVAIYSIARKKLLYPKLSNMPKVATVAVFLLLRRTCQHLGCKGHGHLGLILVLRASYLRAYLQAGEAHTEEGNSLRDRLPRHHCRKP